MSRDTLKQCFFFMLSLGLIHLLILSGGCRKKESPQETRQENEPQSTEPISSSEITDTPPIVENGKIDLRVLYVGLPETERYKDFVNFLGEHFEQVDTADYNQFTEDQTKACDVAIFDKDGLEWISFDISVSGEYSRATMTIGVPGAFWIRKVSRRMGYM